MIYPRIQELRKEQNLTQQQMASLLRVSPAAYSRYERGISDMPMGIICGIALIHHTSVDYIVERTDRQIPHKTSK